MTIENIGVLPREFFPSYLDLRERNLMTYLLLFDRVAVTTPDLEYTKNLLSRQPGRFERLIATQEWLYDKQLLFEYKHLDFPEKEKVLNQASQLPNTHLELEFYDPRVFGTVKPMLDLFARCTAIHLSKKSNVKAVPIFQPDDFTPIQNQEKRGIVLQVVLESLPIPSADTSWEAIVDFRNDEEAKSKLLALRSWMNKIAKEKLSRKELLEEIEYNINLYKQAMKYHKTLKGIGRIESLILSSAEIVDNLLRLKLSGVLKPFLEIRTRETILLLEELSYPGRDLSYFVKVQDEFAKGDS